MKWRLKRRATLFAGNLARVGSVMATVEGDAGGMSETSVEWQMDTLHMLRTPCKSPALSFDLLRLSDLTNDILPDLNIIELS